MPPSTGAASPDYGMSSGTAISGCGRNLLWPIVREEVPRLLAAVQEELGRLNTPKVS